MTYTVEMIIYERKTYLFSLLNSKCLNFDSILIIGSSLSLFNSLAVKFWNIVSLILSQLFKGGLIWGIMLNNGSEARIKAPNAF